MTEEGARRRRSAHETSEGAGRPGAGGKAPLDLSGDLDPVTRAREICLYQLDTRARSRAELAALLNRQGVEPDISEVVLDRLTEVGLIDDTAFATAMVASGRANKGLGRRALAADLRRRGVDEQASAAALAAVDPEDELATARELVGRKLGTMRGLPLQVRVRRLTAMLARKGYSSSLAARVVAEAIAGEDSIEFDDEPYDTIDDD